MGKNTYEIPANLDDAEPVSDFFENSSTDQNDPASTWDDSDFDYANSFISTKKVPESIETYDQIQKQM